MDKIKVTDGLWHSGYPPNGRKFALCLLGNNNIEVGQWDPPFNAWTFRDGKSLPERYVIAWCAIPEHSLLNPKVVETIAVEYI